MEFELKTDLSQGLQVIDFNYDAIKADLAERLSTYGGLRIIADADALKGAKADRARLNKLADALKESKLTVKRDYMRPYEAFEAKATEIINMVAKVSAGIDESVKAYEAGERDEKRAKIQQFFSLAVGDLADVLPFDRLFNARWLNATYKMADIEAEISNTLINLRNNIQVVRDLKTPYEQEITGVLLETLNLGEALARKAKLERQAEAMASVRRPVVTSLDTQETFIGDSGVRDPINAVPLGMPVEAAAPAPGPGERERIEFYVLVTPEQKRAMREFLKSNNIPYGFIRKEEKAYAE